MKITTLQAAVLPTARIEVTGEDGATAEYRLVMDFNSIAKANDLLGRDFADLRAWQNLNSVDTSALCWCAFNRFHPEVTLDQVRSWLAPAQVWQLYSMLLELCFPGISERIDKAVQAGETQPNSPDANA
jgi:hypothetical protein